MASLRVASPVTTLSHISVCSVPSTQCCLQGPRSWVEVGWCVDANVNKQWARVGAASLDDEMKLADTRGLGSRRCENVGFEVFRVIEVVVVGMWAIVMNGRGGGPFFSNEHIDFNAPAAGGGRGGGMKVMKAVSPSLVCAGSSRHRL